MWRKLLNMTLRFIKKDPISELTEEIKELKMRIHSLENRKPEPQVFIRPPEERTVLFSPANVELDLQNASVFEEETPFLPKPKFGDLSLKKGVEATQSDFNNEDVVKLKKRKT